MFFLVKLVTLQSLLNFCHITVMAVIGSFSKDYGIINKVKINNDFNLVWFCEIQ